MLADQGGDVPEVHACLRVRLPPAQLYLPFSSLYTWCCKHWTEVVFHVELCFLLASLLTLCWNNSTCAGVACRSRYTCVNLVQWFCLVILADSCISAQDLAPVATEQNDKWLTPSRVQLQLRFDHRTALKGMMVSLIHQKFRFLQGCIQRQNDHCSCV